MLSYDIDRSSYLRALFAASKAKDVKLNAWEKKFVRDTCENIRFSPKQKLIVTKLFNKYGEVR